ncbi:SIMPL domain-containing protein [Litchfieldia alkalitelluris]|uniref:SIMPL domain-containing protein n=1 Tax=Litchfieldia alkalitelluris TaxID=304268 RepID=UPI0009965DC2|nr:SIMPL domain-containing protein [Litchfieldia alkalitelluris]
MSYYEPPVSFARISPNNMELKNVIKLEGEGKLSIMPDLATVTIGIMTENKSVVAAQQENASRTTKVLETLKTFGVLDRNIQTINYLIQPIVQYIDGKSINQGFQVTHLLEITVKDIESVGSIYDIAINAGANISKSLNYKVDNPSLHYHQALENALKNAQAKAVKLAKYLRVSVNLIPIKIIEQDQQVIPFDQPVYSFQAEQSTQVQPREVQITAKISAFFVYNEWNS